MSKIREQLTRAQFKGYNGSLRSLIRAQLASDSGRREQTVQNVIVLLETSEAARREAAADIVGIVRDQMRADLALKRQDAKRQELFRRHEHAKLQYGQFYAENGAAIAQAIKSITRIVDELPDADLDRLARSPESIIRAFIKERAPLLGKIPGGPPRQLIELIKHGTKRSSGGREWRRKLQAKKDQIESNKIKASSFDRMVMALDAITVGRKLLGDCTGADLLREAVRLEELAKEVTAQSVFYRELAAIVGKTATVRAADNRAGIVGLLTSHYRDPAAHDAEVVTERLP